MTTIGNKLKITLGGESHGKNVYLIAEGLPAGIEIAHDEVRRELMRRATGKAYTSGRIEPDLPLFEGLKNGCTTGAPLKIVIENEGANGESYDSLGGKLRPSHADFPAAVKGLNAKGGGEFSARLTAPLVALGAIIRQMLAAEGITVGSHVMSVGNLYDDAFDAVNVDEKQLGTLSKEAFPVISDEAKRLFIKRIERARAEGDSVGGVIECAAVGMPVGVGGAYWHGLESKLANILFGVPAVKGVEFGVGFDGATMMGSSYNDELYIDNNEIKTRTNRVGGILGGMSNGMPIVFSVAFKPTPSIAKEQNTVDYLSKTNCKISVEGNHDACIVARAAAIVEAATLIALYDAILEEKQ